MKTIFIIAFLFFLQVEKGQQLAAQPLDIQLPGFIEQAKRATLPILCPDDTVIHYGTGVLIGNGKKSFILTCEHVIAIKDSLRKTIGYHSNIYTKMSRLDDTTFNIPVEIIHKDEINDFAILRPIYLKSIFDSLGISSTQNKHVTANQCLKTENLKEGYRILYLGYPMFMGIGNVNYPLVRTGIISQLVKGSSTFVIDGFVQGGQSGGPVFGCIYNETTKKWEKINLIGITKSYRHQKSDLLKEVSYSSIPEYGVLENTGFSYVVSMDVILPILSKLFQ